MSSLLNLPAAELVTRLAAGDVTSAALTEECLSAISQRDSSVRAFLKVDAERSLAQARDIDARRAAGDSVGILQGLPIAVKDLICEEGVSCTCASRMLENYVSPYSAHVVERLRAAGAVLVGRANMDEFAMGSSGENSAFQVTANPWDLERTPGGSSSGSAAAVAGRLTPVSLGSDTGGSIRQPASLCGVVGLKPTYGRVSRYGLVAFASSLDQIGPFASDVHGAALLLEAMAGHDPRDSTSVDRPVPSYTSSLNEPLKGLRIGVAREHFAEGLDDEVAEVVRRALDVYRSLGAELIDIELPHSKYAVAVYYLIAPSEASSNLARYDGIHYGHRTEKASSLADLYARSRGEAFGTEVKRRIMLGVYALSSGYYDQYYVKALKVRRLIRNDFDAAFAKVDVIAGPVTPSTAFKLNERTSDPMAMYLSDIYTIPANLAGIPGISIPAGLSPSGLPIGLQLQAAPFAEETLLRAARMFEAATDHHRLIPPMARS
jgi:aspartyl-tRNA(Asn)/glutamyl-tRNA(Gln) amidotransferase subunit A